MTNWTSFDEPDLAGSPAWVRTVRRLLVFFYPPVAIGAAAFLVWIYLTANSYLIELPVWQMTFLALLVAALGKSLAFGFFGNWLRSHHDRKARRIALAVSWLAGPGISLLMIPLSAMIGEGVGLDLVVLVALPEACVAAMISLSLLSPRD